MKTVKWGLIGCGDISRKRVAPALRDLANCELIAVSRANASAAADFAREFGAKRYYAYWQEMLQDPDVEAVYIATPVHLHYEQTLAAAAAGKQVLCEKPMAMTTAQCDLMIQACAENNVQLSVAYYRHFYPVIARMKQIIQSGVLGDIALVQINAFETFDKKPGEPRSWFLQKELSGGGPMMDFGCHRIEVLQNLMGPLQSAKGVTSNAHFHNRTVEDTAVAVLANNRGSIGVVSVTHTSYIPRDTLDVYAESGHLSVQRLNDGDLTITTAQGQIVERHPPHLNLHIPHIYDFTCALLENRPPTFLGKHAREISRILDLIYER